MTDTDETAADRTDAPPSADAVRAAVRRRSASIESAELDRLEAAVDGELNDAQRTVVESMASRIVDGVLAPVERALEDDEAIDPDGRRTVRACFTDEEA